MIYELGKGVGVCVCVCQRFGCESENVGAVNNVINVKLKEYAMRRNGEKKMCTRINLDFYTIYTKLMVYMCM